MVRVNRHPLSHRGAFNKENGMRRRILAAAPLALLASPATAGTDDDAEPWITLGASGAISKSTVLDTGDQFSFTFTKPGQFEYSAPSIRR
jgi:hypothetical protein